MQQQKDHHVTAILARTQKYAHALRPLSRVIVHEPRRLVSRSAGYHHRSCRLLQPSCKRKAGEHSAILLPSILSRLNVALKYVRGAMFSSS